MADNHKLDDILKFIRLETLADFGEGVVAVEFDDAVSDVFANIEKYPYKMNDGKPVSEARKITLELTFTPELTVNKSVKGGPGGQSRRDMIEVGHIGVTVNVKSTKPSFKSGAVNMIPVRRGGQIVGAKFNPHNNENPMQMELDYDPELEERDGV